MTNSRRAVLAGVAAINRSDANSGELDRPESDGIVGLLEQAARAAVADCGLTGHRAAELATAVDVVALAHGSWSLGNAGGALAARLGATSARVIQYEVGVPQQQLVSDALTRIAAGEAEVVLVAGAENRARHSRAARAGRSADEPDGHGEPELVRPHGEIVAPAEIAARVWDPVVQYALIDSALRSAEHFSIAAQCAEIDDLWSRLSAVSADNARAAFPGFRSSEQLRSPLDGNRPLAFPYRKWHSTQWTVDQAAALLLCAEDSAHRFGLDPTRLIHPHVALESSFALSLSRRAEMHRWPAMELLGEVAAQHLDRPLDDIELVELYSCFPAAVRVQQRELRLPLAGTPTVTGSMSFAGGPFNHATFQSTATMVEKLRAAPGALGLVTTVSGLLTKPGLMVWGTTAPPRGLLVADLAEHAAARTAVAEVADTVEASGPITVAACTATYDAAGPLDLIVIGDSAAGRVVARFADPDLAARAETEELIGTVIDAS